MNPKVSLITFSIAPNISPLNPENLNIVKEYAENAVNVLRKEKLDIVHFKDIVDSRESALKAISELDKENPDVIIIQIGIWPSPSLIIDIINSLKNNIPIILWAVDDTRIVPLVPACQIHGSFDDMEIKHDFIYSNPEDILFYKKIRQIAYASKTVRELSGTNLGLFGGRYMHMYTGTADPIQVKKIFGIEINHINEFCLVKEAKKINDDEVKKYSNYIHQKYGKITVPKEVEDRSIRLYFAMEKLRKEYELDLATVKCMLEVQGEYCSHCLSVSKHIDEGFVISCEGDINGAITMQILKLLSDSASGFGDVCKIDRKNNILTLQNCGAFATEFAEKPKDVKFPEQLKNLVPGEGTGMTTAFVCKPGQVTLARLGRVNGDYIMQISSGEAVKLSGKYLLNNIEPHIFIKLEKEPEFFIQNCRSNHLHWVYEDYREEILQFCKILGIKTAVC